MTRAIAAKPNHAVVLIHGIGDQLQGETLERLASSYFMSRPQQEISPRFNKSTLRLAEDGDPGTSRNAIGSYTADVLTIDQEPDYIFAEVYWADISRVTKGFFGFIAALWQLMTGLRFVIDAAARPKQLDHFTEPNEPQNFLAKLVYAIGFTINSLLAGPLMATNAHLLILTIGAFLSMQNIFDLDGVAVEFVFCSLVIVMLIAFTVLVKKRYMLKWTYYFLLFCFVLIFVYVAISSDEDDLFLSNIDRYAEAVAFIMSSFWRILAFLSGVLLIAGLIAHWKGAALAPLTLAVAGPCVNIGVWALVVSTFWVFTVNTVLHNATGRHLEDFKKIIIGSIPYLGLVWIASIALGCTILAIMYLRKRHAAGKLSVPESPWYRLIFSPAGVVLVYAAIIIWIAGTVADYFCVGLDMEALTLRVAPVVLLFVGLLGVLRDSLGLALDLLLDIVTFFRREDVPVHYGVAGFGGDNYPRSGKPSIRPASAERRHGEREFLKRCRIADRFTRLINHLAAEHGDLKKLTIIAHSQGTITAIRELEDIRRWWLGPAETGNRPSLEIQLVTMGSPYTHIYEHYFPEDFKAPSLPDVTTWINIYTVNDYVGTWIGKRSGSATPLNIEREHEARKIGLAGVRPIGHNGYWTDKVVMDQIRSHAPL